ncbi:10986_t:CDS:2 [Cetraspora pellucida]|uniref:10986_t:CDS:1 n=1 Tax=Cetraspora pellucida TaxID=1433469 RepID=A0A9N9D2M6_9GLOM|nr:10986_t:CDS:2 [Cetraspora pellucida]
MKKAELVYDEFTELNNSNKVNLVVKLFLAKGLEKKVCSVVYIRNSKCIQQRKNKEFREAAIGSLKIIDFFSNTQLPVANSDNEELNEESDEKLGKELNEKKIFRAIEFVNQIINKEALIKTEEAYYIAVLYFLRLLLQGQKKMKTSKTVIYIINDRL